MIKMHSIQKGSCFLYFLEIHDKQADKNVFENNIVSYTGHSWEYLYRRMKDGSTILEILGNAG